MEPISAGIGAAVVLIPVICKALYPYYLAWVNKPKAEAHAVKKAVQWTDRAKTINSKRTSANV